METTCVLIKPDAMLAHKIGEIIARFEKAGLEITNCKMISLEKAVLAQHYAHIVEKPFYPEVESFMQSSPSSRWPSPVPTPSSRSAPWLVPPILPKPIPAPSARTSAPM